MRIVLEGEITDLMEEAVAEAIKDLSLWDEKGLKIDEIIYKLLKEAIEGKNIEVASWFQDRIKDAFLNFTDFTVGEIWTELNPEIDEMKDQIKLLTEKVKLLEENKK